MVFAVLSKIQSITGDLASALSGWIFENRTNSESEE